MKRKNANTIWIVLIVLLILGIVAFYVYDVLVTKTPYDKNLFRTIAIVFMLLGTLVRLTRGQGRRALEIYEKAYEEELGAAFDHKPLLRKKLLCACRLYNESNYKKALKYLFQLLQEAESEKDAIPVYLFIALCYTDGGAPAAAIKPYEELLKLDPDNAQVHSNLGLLYGRKGDYEMALAHYNRAIALDPFYYSAYANRANYYFDIEDYPHAIEDALTALEVKNNGKEAASLLAIIFALRGDEENKKKYYHIAIASGYKPEQLNNAIEHYMHEQESEEDTDEAEE